MVLVMVTENWQPSNQATGNPTNWQQVFHKFEILLRRIIIA
jgi:hypothetical protein